MEGFEPIIRECAICGKEFTITDPRARDRKYCSNGCLMKSKNLARTARVEAAHSEAMQANYELNEELLAAGERLRRCQEEANRLRHDIRLMATTFRHLLNLGILVVDRNSPAIGHINQYGKGLRLMNEYCDRQRQRNDEIEEYARKSRELEAREEEARRRHDVDEMGRVRHEIAQLDGEFNLRHPEYWAESNIDALKREWYRDHPGGTLIEETNEMIWYREEAKRRRAKLDAAERNRGIE